MASGYIASNHVILKWCSLHKAWCKYGANYFKHACKYVHACMCACMNACMNMCIEYVNRNVSMYACIYVCLFTCLSDRLSNLIPFCEALFFSICGLCVPLSLPVWHWNNSKDDIEDQTFRIPIKDCYIGRDRLIRIDERTKLKSCRLKKPTSTRV